MARRPRTPPVGRRRDAAGRSGVRPGLGAGLPRVDFSIDGGASHPLDPREPTVFSGADSRASGRHAVTGIRLDGEGLRPDPVVALSAGRSARSVGDRRSRRRSGGPTQDGEASQPIGQVVYEMHVGTFTPRGHLGGGGGRARRRSRDLGVTVDRDDAGRRFRRAVRLGLRRRRPLRADAPLRHARRPARVRRSRARARPRRDPRRRLQPPRAGRQLPVGLLARLLHRPVHERLGRRDQLRGPARRRARSSSRTRATGSTSSTSTACGSTRRRTSTTPRRAHPRRRSSRRARDGGRRRARSTSSPRTNRRTRGSCATRRRAATASTRCGTTTSTTAPMVALTGRREAYYTRLPGHAAGVHLVREVRLSVSGPVVPLAEASAAARRRSICRRTRSSTYLENHDQVANSAFGRAAAPADVAAALPRDDGADAARPGDADAVSGPGVRLVGAVPVLRRSPRGAGEAVRTRARRVPRAVPEPADDRVVQRRCRRRSTGDLRALQAGSRASATRHAEAYALHRDLLRCAATTPVISHARHDGSTARCSRPRAFVLRYLRRGATAIGCWSSISAAISISRRRREPLLAPPAGCALARCSWSSEAARYGGQGTPPLRRRRPRGAFPAKPRCCSRSGRSRDCRRSMRDDRTDAARSRGRDDRGRRAIRCRGANGS